MDVSLASAIGDDEYLETLNKTLTSIQEQITPDIVLYDAGVDVFSNDKLGNLQLSFDGIKKRDELVIDHYRNKNIPVATVIGGGYSKDHAELADRHSIIFDVALEYLKKNNFN